MSCKEQIIAADSCNFFRLASRMKRLEEKAEKVNKLIEKTESQTKEVNEMLDLVRLAKQMLELVVLEENYVNILEETVENENTNMALMSSLQKSIKLRDIRSKAALKLCTELMRDKLRASHLF